jgi:hypothetical protein
LHSSPDGEHEVQKKVTPLAAVPVSSIVIVAALFSPPMRRVKCVSLSILGALTIKKEDYS